MAPSGYHSGIVVALYFVCAAVATTNAENVSWVGSAAKSDVKCQDVHNENASAACYFVQNTDDCQIDEGFINYIDFIFCDVASTTPLAVVLEVCFLVMYFILLGITCDSFFCQSLVIIAKTLHMNDNIAGVTLLAVGNGAPDIFSAVAAIKVMNNGDAGLAIGALLGACMYVTTLVAGTIAVMRPFQAMQRPILRDIIFLISAVFFVFCILYRQEINVTLSIVPIILYVVYVTVVLGGRYIYQRQKAARTVAVDAQTAASVNADVEENAPTRNRGSILEDSESFTERSPLFTKLDSTAEHPLYPFEEFVIAIRPIEIATWGEKKWYKKIYFVLRAPIYMLLILNIPVVDQSKPKDCWNRHLRCLNIIIGITLGTLIASYKYSTYLINGQCPVLVVVFIASCALAVAMYCVTSNEEPPWWHAAFSFLGFAISVIWINAVAAEIVNILTSFGVLFNISSTILGLTILAWGNSIADMVADVAVAKQNMPRVGISACYGGPFFNIMMGVGVPFLIKTLANGTVTICITSVDVCLVGFLFFVCIATLFALLIQNFHYTRKYGVFLYVTYATFIVVALLAEVGVIPQLPSSMMISDCENSNAS